jgi:acid stress-induced BolA-like protein IbaG/YrbA
MFSADEIKRLIEEAIPGAVARVESDDGEHFSAVVVATAFTGKNVVQQHQMVYRALGTRMGREIHALQLNTRAQ